MAAASLPPASLAGSHATSQTYSILAQHRGRDTVCALPVPVPVWLAQCVSVPFCSDHVISGAKQLGESGYWTLTSLTPPEPTPAMKAGSKGVKQSGEGEGKRVSILEAPVVMEV